MMSYFGTDQSQVQRFLTAKSVDEARSSLLISAYWKIPLQARRAARRCAGVRVLPVPAAADAVQPGARPSRAEAEPAAYQALATQYRTALAQRERGRAWHRGARRRRAREDDFRSAEKRVEGVARRRWRWRQRVTGEQSRDVNYIIPHFVLFDCPSGLTGIFIAAVMAAAMSAVAAELNSLATATVIDFYRRWLRPDAPDARVLRASKIATVIWGLFACSWHRTR